MTPDRKEAAQRAVMKGSELGTPPGARCSRCFKIVGIDGHSGYCSSDCFLAENDETSQSRMRELLLARDQGKCALCGNETLALRAFADGELAAGGRRRKNGIVFMSKLGFSEKDVVSGRSLWDFDHINPRAANGPTTLANARTLCRPCHEKVTSEFAVSRTQARKPKGRRFGR